MLDYKLLEALALVIIEGGFEKAAIKLHITQSAVSQRIKQLEDGYGQLLLQRTSPPKATSAGKVLLSHYRQVKFLEDDLFLSHNKEKLHSRVSLAVGINADTLATWFFDAVKPLIDQEEILLDLFVDDQDETHKLMQEGKVWGCITTRSAPLQGCKAVYLGCVKYGLFCTRGFAEHWFANGLTVEAFTKAPAARFNRKDDLNSKFLRILLGETPQNPPTFFIPSTEIYANFVEHGYCYGILPEQQSRPLEQQGQLINLSPAHSVDVKLYWHCWSLKSELAERFSAEFIRRASNILH